MFLEIFKTAKPILGMLHLKGDNAKARLKKAIIEADVYAECGINGMIVEDYYGDVSDVENALAYLSKERPKYILGVNVLKSFSRGYQLARQYGAKFMQIDSICGHLEPKDEKSYFEMIDNFRKDAKVAIIGGVRFKYQPTLSNRSLEDDLGIGIRHCDAIAVTGAGTGMSTGTEKINQFRDIIHDFPLVVAAGMAKDTVAEKLLVGDAAIVGSTFKDTRKDTGDVSAENVRDFMDEVRRCFR
jgi:uncharacterized protein